MGFGFKQPLVGEKRCVTTLITAAETMSMAVFSVILMNKRLWKITIPRKFLKSTYVNDGASSKIRFKN